MKISVDFKTMLSDFLTINAETTLSVGIIGSIFAKDVQINYFYFFLPFVLSVIYMLPCIPTYLKEDMSVKQVMLQRVVEFVIIEATTLAATYFILGHVMTAVGYVAVGVSVLIFDLLTYLIKWYFEKATAEKINKAIREMRSKNVGK